MDCKLNLGQLSLILFKKSYLYISKKLNRSYLTLICLLIINNFTIAQIEFNDSIWSDLKTNDMSNIIDLPVFDEESKLLLINNKRLELFTSYFEREDIDFSVHDYLELLSKSFVTSKPKVHIGHIKFYLHEYAKFPKFRGQLLLSSQFIYDSDHKLDSIVISTKNIESPE